MASNKIERRLVVVGMDGSDQSIAALRWAARYAEATGAAIRAVRVWDDPARRPFASGTATLSQENEDLMRMALEAEIARVYPGQPGPEVEARLSYGHPAQVLIDESKDADLLVVGSSGEDAFTGMLVGSVSIHCVTNACCPVTVVRGTEWTEEAAR
jgi:nucleotide-binding universal stress UspA family protein